MILKGVVFLKIFRFYEYKTRNIKTIIYSLPVPLICHQCFQDSKFQNPDFCVRILHGAICLYTDIKWISVLVFVYNGNVVPIPFNHKNTYSRKFLGDYKFQQIFHSTHNIYNNYIQHSWNFAPENFTVKIYFSVKIYYIYAFN